VEPEELLERAQKLLPALRDRTEETERTRNLPDETIEDLRNAGLFKIPQPALWGGYELDPIVFLDVARLLATACGSTGWVYSILAVHNWQLACMPEQAQRDVWDPDPDVLLASSYTPRGVVEQAPGGYRLSGRWQFSSGCKFANWALLGGHAPQPDGTSVFLTFLVPESDYTIKDIWHVMGLKGTGSNEIVVEDAFVPSYRTNAFVSGSDVSDAVSYRLPFTAVFGYSLTASILGMAQGALAEHIAWTIDRMRITKGSKVAEEAFTQIRLAKASAIVDSVDVTMRASFRDLTEVAREGEVPRELLARVRRDQVEGSSLAITAIDLVFENSGASALRLESPIQRFWRDAHAARMHNSNVPEPILASYGALQFGLPVPDRAF
jgi:3-hydroxy-9,10-secoandrosta-1,3,5(10)-triene-9,17-dione monooxygenase